MRLFVQIAAITFCVTGFVNSLLADDKDQAAKLAAESKKENEQMKKALVKHWQQFNATKIKSVKVKLGSFHGFAEHKTTFVAEIQDEKLLSLFKQGLDSCLIDTPKAGFGGMGLSPNGEIEILGTNGEKFQLVFHLYPRHDAKEPDKMSPGFGFMTIGPSFGGLQVVYSPGWAMFLNEVFTQNNKPKLSEHAFNKLSGKYWLESSLKEAEEALKKTNKEQPK